jgi:ankyrin repeat protein
VGGDLFAANPFAIDFRDDTLTIYDRAAFKPPATTQPQTVRMIREVPNIRGSVEGRNGWFAIDTGAMLHVQLDPLFTVLHRDIIDGKPLMPGIGFVIGGQTPDWDVTLSTAHFFGREWRDVNGSLQEGATAAGKQIDVYPAGRIGALMFDNARLTMDYLNQQMWVEWRDEPEPLEPYLARMRKRATRDVTKTTALMMTASGGRADAVRALLADGADPNAADASGLTALMAAADAGSADCAVALLAHKADTNAQAAYRAITPLHRAAEAGSADVIALLLKAGAKPNVLTTAKQSPLLRATQHGSAKCVALLLAAGADPLPADKTGKSPLLAAAQQGNLAIISDLLDHGAKIEARDQQQQTALSTAAYARRPDAVKLLLSRGASVRGTDALHAAAAANSPDCIALLLAAGADVNAKDSGGRTPLETAARQGGARAMRMLLHAGATTRPAN